MRRPDFNTWLEGHLKSLNLTKHRLAALCDLNPIYWYQATSRNKEIPPPWALRRAAPHLHIPFVELLIRAGHVTERELVEWVERG